jgi:hypothetical protein
MANALVKAIRGEGKIEYMGGDNPLQTQFIRLSDMHVACRFLSSVATNGGVGDDEFALGVLLGMVRDELRDIAEKIDETNAEICRAINKQAPFKAE